MINKTLFVTTCLIGFLVQGSVQGSTKVSQKATDFYIKNNKGIDYPGSWSRFINSQNNSRYTAECDELDSGNIKCSFNRLRVLHDETEINRLKKQLNEMKLKNNEEIQSWISDLKKACIYEPKLSEVQNKNVGYSNKDGSQRTIIDSLQAEFKKVCDAPTKDNLINLQRQLINETEQTCTIYEKQYTSIFKYDLKAEQWVSQEEPYGPCGEIAIEYFTKAPNGFGWSYTLKQIYINKEGHGLMGVKCSALADEEEIAYSLGSDSYENNKVMNCKYINFEAII